MTRKLLTVGTVLLLVAMVALAADAISGKWTFEMPGRGGGGGGGGNGGGAPRIATLDLKVDGMNLTGTITQPMGGMRGGGGGGGGTPPAPTPTAISNGKVSGNTITFDVTRQTQNGDFTTKYEGTVNGDTMHIKMTTPDMGNGPTTREVDAKRATT